MKKHLRFGVSTTLAAMLTVAAGCAVPPPAPTSGRPKLVVVLVVDQMRADYITQYGHQWTKGLRRLIDTGAVFPLAAYPYANTVTCAGHSTISTGHVPRSHGMIGNSWYDRSLARSVSCTEDPDVTSVPFGGREGREHHSPRALLTPTFSDELRAQSSAQPPPTIVGLSLKARSALTLAGHPSPTTYAIWEEDDGTWATSSAYTNTAWPAVEAYATAHPISEDYGKAWTRLLPESAYLFTDQADGEPRDGVFPHALESRSGEPDTAYASQWERSPMSDKALGQLAQHLVTSLGLGQGTATDMLGVSFSALDLVGHAFGPRSHEVQDTLVQLDATIGALLDHLDQVVGPNQYVIALSADHGVAPMVEQSLEAGLSAGRFSSGQIRTALDDALAPMLGKGTHVAAGSGVNVYLTPGALARVMATSGARDAVRQAMANVAGQTHLYWADELASSVPTTDAFLQAARNSYDASRSGDLMIFSGPFWYGQAWGIGHGSPYDYDRRVPVLFAGAGILPGRYLVPASPVDIAPTLAYLTGVTLTTTDGAVLTPALRPALRQARR